NPVVLAPRWSPAEIDIRSNAEGIDRHAHRCFKCRDARPVDQRDVFVGRRMRLTPRIGKGVPRRLDDAQWSSHRVPKVVSYKFRDSPAAFGLGYLPAQPSIPSHG